jgi:hypothetical protein
MATAICTAAAVAIIMDGAEAAATITAGVIIATTDRRWMLLSFFHCPNESRPAIWTVAPPGAAGSNFQAEFSGSLPRISPGPFRPQSVSGRNGSLPRVSA